MPRFGRRCRVVALVLAAAMTAAACGDDTSRTNENLSPRSPSAPSTSKAPFTGTTLEPGEVVAVDNLDGARLQSVDKGVVRSFETSVEITEIGSAEQIGAESAAYRAEGDARLVVFTMTAEDNDRETELEGDVVAAVAVDDKQREVPGFESTLENGGSASYAVAVPEDRRSVELQLKYNGEVQSFDLLEGEPTGERPEALYRADRGTMVYQEALAPSQFTVTVWEQPHVYTATVHIAELGYFPVRGNELPSAKDKGWLSLWVGADASPSTCAAPLAAYSLKDEKGATYQPAQSVSEVKEPGVIDTPVSVVAFEVPADLEKATLTISAPQVTCQVSTASFELVPASGAATIDITLPKN